MKRINLLLIVSFLLMLSAGDVNAQLKVKGSSGKVVMGQDRLFPTEDTTDVVTAFVYGKRDGDSRAGSKLAFGDFGRYNFGGWNVFVGEYDTLDTDKLWLHGKEGFRLTCGGQTETTIMSFNNTNPLILNVNAYMSSQSFNVPSYSFSQVNAQRVSDSYNKLLSLESFSFVENNNTDQAQDRENVSQNYQDNEEMTEKERRDVEHFRTLDNERRNVSRKRNMFDVESVQENFPELVITDSTNQKYIDYIGLLPILVNALQEQDRIIKAYGLKLQEVIESNEITPMDTSLFISKSSLVNTENNKEVNAFLYQNTPNPFNQTTEIKYFLPENVSNAKIYVFDMQGALQMTFSLTETGFGIISISASQLNAGMYFYTLVVDNKEVETKKMILTN